MKKSMLKSRIVPLVGTFACAVAAMTAAAEDGLGPMAGAGGVMRDAERRVLTPVGKPKEAKELPVAEGVSKPEPKLEGVKGATIGQIAAIKVFGSTEFAEREGVSEKLLEALGGDGDKTVGDVLEAIQKVRQNLVKQGYYLVSIQLAKKGTYDKEQKVLSVLVDEGRFGKVNVRFEDEEEDGCWFSEHQIHSRFKDIGEGETFDYNRLRNALFDANSHPDLTIDTDISVRKPIEGEGNDRRVARYADLDLTVHESLPFHALWEINNYGLRDVNEWQTSLALQYLNLTKHDDVLTVSPAMSLGAELFSCAASYMLPHDYWFGGNTTVYGGWSRVEIDDIIPALDLEGTGYFVGLQHSENLYNTDNHLLALSAGVLWRYIEDQYTVASKSLNERGTHILPLSLALSYTGKRPDCFYGRNFATVQGVYNVMDAGDDIDKTWTGAEENYWLFRWQVARLQSLFGTADSNGQLNHNWQLFMRLEGQYTDQTLIPTEKLMMGGYNCLRGYRTRGYVGDYGLYGTFEFRTPLLVDLFASLVSDRTDKVAFDRLQFLTFFDYGWSRYNDLPAGYGDEGFLCSAGIGARLAVTQYSQLRCDIAFPIIDSDVGKADDDYDRNMEVYFGFQLQF